MKNEYLAHTENNSGKVHILKEHLSEVGKLAERFSNNCNMKLAEAAKWAGMLHDLGKYRDEFQEYLVGKRERSNETHHAIYGAALAFKIASETRNQMWLPVVFAIAAHHAGLYDKAVLLSKFQEYKTAERLPPLIEHFEREIGKLPKKTDSVDFIGENDFLKLEMATRMIFSTLVDADFLDTEKHYLSGRERENSAFEPGKLLEKLEAERLRKIENAREIGADENLIAIRNRIFENCLQKAKERQGFFSLTVPTGGGKTLSAMAFALKHTEIHNLRRVIVVIPYLSIIEQNAKEYSDIFGKEIIIENHSGVKIDSEEREKDASSEKQTRNMLEYAAENWDAPIIVTTSVQFIESLFAAKPSKCRKLHNIANSVVIFDEVQTLPAKLLEPLFDVWKELQRNYGVSFVFSTATQPAFRRNNFNFKNGFADNEMKEITENTDEIFHKLNRVRYEFKEFQKPKSWEEIAVEMRKENQVLAIVNTRKHAFELWDTLSGKLTEHEKYGLFHLSSAMCAEHRLEIIEEIKGRLKNNLPCRVVSTQLVEAGVDLDFPVVFRAVAPLDSIVQAAGRCNREGKLEKGRVVVFTPSENDLPPGIYKNSTQKACTFLHELNEEDLATNHKIFADYFRRVYQSEETGKKIQQLRKELNFREISQSKDAKVIEDSGTPIIVFYKGKENDSALIIEKVRMDFEKKKFQKFFNFKDDFRRLQRFMVNLRQKEFEELLADGRLESLLPNADNEKQSGLYVLKESNVFGKTNYDENLGVKIKQFEPTDFIA